jgi:hypothetical protein
MSAQEVLEMYRYIAVVLLLFLSLTFILPADRASANGGGTIAYVRNGAEIRLIEANGSNDRRLWTHPDAKKELGIFDVAWRPDGKELAFSSGHAAVTSLYHSDLYAIRPDGTGFRKLTNPPDRGEFAHYPKGGQRHIAQRSTVLQTIAGECRSFYRLRRRRR